MSKIVIQKEQVDKTVEVKNKIKEITKPIEANIVGILWKEPNLYFDYPELNKDMFNNPVWKFYYTIGLKIANKGINKIDEVAAEIYLKEHDKAYEKYNEYGGFQTIDKLLDFVSVENINGYIEDLKKWSALYSVVENLSIDEKVIEDVMDMNVNELYDYFNAQVNNIFINVDDGVDSHRLQDGIDEVIKEADQGMNVGMPIPSEILNNEIGGVMRGQIILVGGLSGAGKTTITIQLMLSALFEQEEAGVIMLNEQDRKKWQQEMLTWIINNKLLQKGDKPFNKIRWREGNFTKQEKEYLYAAKDYLEQKMKNNEIILTHFKSYSREKAERVIRKYASLGIKNFVLDTFKISSNRNNNEAFWLSMQEDMRKFDDLIKPSNLNVSLWVTLQLQKGSVFKRYLTSDDIGMAKNVLDVASVSLLIRRLRNDEYKGEKNEIKVIKPVTSESMKSGRMVDLDRNKQYVIIFIDKNRNGRSQEFQIVAEQNLGYLTYKEVGVCEIPFGT